MTHPFSMTFSMTCLASDANSAAVPPRFGNSIAFSRLVRTLSLSTLVMGVSKVPGAMVTTRMPCRDRSRVMGRVMDATAPLEAEYDTWPICPSKAAADETIITTPCSLSPEGVTEGGDWDSCGRNCRTRSIVPRRLMLRTKSRDWRLRGRFLPSRIWVLC